MYYVTVDSVSVKEIAQIEFELGCDIFNLPVFESQQEALDFGVAVKRIAPHCFVGYDI